jgi:PAS domain S-box-containing protein
MQDQDKTKERLIDELVFLRERVAGLEAAQIEHQFAAGSCREPRTLHRIVADNTYDWEYWLSPERLFLYVSPSCQRICGYSADEFKANPELLSDIVHPDDLPHYERHMRQDFFTQAPCELEFRIIHRDGAVRWIGHVCQPVFDENGKIIGRRGSNREITRRKLMEEMLQESERKYRELVESLHEGIWVVDGEARTTFVNSRMAEMLGYTREEMQGRRLFSFMDEENTETAKRYLKRREEGIKEQHEFELVKKDGTRVFTVLEAAPSSDENGKFTGAVASVMDITERKKQEQALRESEERFRSTFDQAPIGSAMLGLDLSAIRVNRELCRMLGRSEEELLRLKFTEYTHQDDVASDLGNISSLLSGDIDHYETEKRYIRGDGRIVRARVSVRAVRDGAGKVLYLLSGVIDITALREAETAVKHSEELLRLVIDYLPVLVSYIDSDRRYRVNNKPYEQWFGQTSLEIYGKHPREVLGKETYLKVEDLIEKAFSGETVTYERDIAYGGKGIRHIQGTFVPHFGEKGEVKGLVTLTSDITERKWMEEELRLSEEHFRCTFDQAPLGAALLGTDFRFQRVNPSLCEITGYSEEELLSRTFVDITHPDHIAADTSAMRRILSGEIGIDRYHVEKRYIRRDGRVIWIRLSSRLVRKGDGSPSHFLALIEDITERRQIQKDLQETKDRLSLALKASGAGTWRWDPVEDRITWDGYPHQVFGFKPAQVGTAEDYFTALHPDDRERVKEATGDALRKGGRFDLEYRVVWPDGSTHHILDRGEMYRTDEGPSNQMVGICFDITERKKVENALLESRALLSTIIESIPFELWAIGRDGRYMLANSVCVNRYGNLLGRKPEQVCADPETLSAWLENNRRTFGGELVKGDVKSTFGGGERFYHNIIAPIRDGDQVRGIVGVNIDITERKMMEEELRKSRNELELRVKERTAALEKANEELWQIPSKLIAAQEEERKRLASELHDSIGQTLAAMKLWVEMVLKLGDEGDCSAALSRLEQFVPILQRSIEETRGICMGLRPSMLDTMGLLAALEWLRRECMKLYPNRHIELETGFAEEEIPEILKVIIFRIVQEALNNIAKHSKAEWVDISLSKNEGGIELAVSDDGVGMDVNQILRTSTARSLGLTSMRERAELTGGSFTIESTPGEGTSIRACWPVEAEGRP